MGKKSRNQLLLNKIATVLATIRTDMNLSQEAVYNDTGIHIGRIETGSTNISLSTLDEMLSYYDVSFLDFFKKVEDL